MALTQVQSSVWTAKVLMSLQKALVIAQPSVSGFYDLEVSREGKEAYVHSLADVTVQNYTKYTSLSIAEMTDTRQVVPIDQQKAFTVPLDDIDDIQSKPDVMSSIADQAAYQLLEASDSFLAGKYTEATSIGAALTIDTTNVFTRILTAMRMLDEANVPRDGRVLILSPRMLEFLLQNTPYQNAASESVLNGSVARFMGFDVLVSNSIAKTGTSPTEVHHALALHPMAWCFQSQIQKIESVRKHDQFVDILKGLHTYGGKVLRAPAVIDLMMQR
jgi:hypothetical protein